MHAMIRPYAAADLAALHAINVAGAPGVGPVSQAALAAIIAQGHCLVCATQTEAVCGFLLTLGPDADYASPNYQWFDARYEDFVYVDRIAVAPAVQGKGLGTSLYEQAFTAYAGQALLIGCEVNTAPPNPGSLRFHTRLGFSKIGAKAFSPDYAVMYLARRLAS